MPEQGQPSKWRSALRAIKEAVVEDVPDAKPPTNSAASSGGIASISSAGASPTGAGQTEMSPLTSNTPDPRSLKLLEEVLESPGYQKLAVFLTIVSALRETLKVDSMIYPTAFKIASLQGLTTMGVGDAVDSALGVIASKRSDVEASLERHASDVVASRQQEIGGLEGQIATSRSIIEGEQAKIRDLSIQRDTMLEGVRGEQRKAQAAKQNFGRACELKARELQAIKDNITRFSTK